MFKPPPPKTRRTGRGDECQRVLKLSLGSLVIVIGLCVARVNELRVMFVHEADESFGFQLLKRESSQGSADLQPLRHDGRRDQLVRRNFFVQFIVRSCGAKGNEIKGASFRHIILEHTSEVRTIISFKQPMKIGFLLIDPFPYKFGLWVPCIQLTFSR